MSKGSNLVVFKSDKQTKEQLKQRATAALCSYHIGLDDAAVSDKPIKFVLSGNGLKKIVTNRVGSFIISAEEVPGLETITEGVLLSTPRIPYILLLRTISFFREVMAKFNNSEAMVQFYYNVEDNQYILHCPEQEVSGASISFKRDEDMDKNHLLVLDVHSHNTMGAFFSAVDDADEKETRLFGVVGQLDKDQPAMKFRMGVGGIFRELNIFDIFENPFEDVSFPDEWLTKCVSRKAVTYHPTTYRPGATGVAGSRSFNRTTHMYGEDFGYGGIYEDYFGDGRSKDPLYEYEHLMTTVEKEDFLTRLLEMDLELLTTILLKTGMVDDVFSTVTNLLVEED